jgi:hypothetical protein
MRRTFVVKFVENKIFYETDGAVTLGDTNIPDSFDKFKPNVCWELEVLKFDEKEGNLYAKILNYDSSQHSYSKQTPFPGHINKIVFNDIDTTNLLHCTERSRSSLSSKTALKARARSISTLQPFRNQPSQAPQETTIQNKLPFAPPEGKDTLLPTPREKFFKTERITQHIKVPFVNLEYYDGYVCFKYRPYKLLPEVEVRVNNEFIRTQFDCVSKYIGMQIGKNKAEFILILMVTKNEFDKEQSFEIESVVSKEIERIDSNIIENVKYTHAFNQMFGKRPIIDDVSKLKTSEEFFTDNFGSNLQPSQNDPKSILEKAFEFKKSKHYHPLKYLADKHKANVFKLRFAVKPFSFLFLVEGVARDYFVLETYDESLATYIWAAEKDVASIKSKFKELEELMSAFEETNRYKYISSKPEGFFRIIHDYTNDVDGFNKWKDKLDKIIL